MSDMTSEVLSKLAHASDQQKTQFLKMLSGKPPERRRPGTIKQAATILECCPRTVARYADKGLLHRIRLSQRKVRYDLAECQRLAENGIGESL